MSNGVPWLRPPNFRSEGVQKTVDRYRATHYFTPRARTQCSWCVLLGTFGDSYAFAMEVLIMKTRSIVVVSLIATALMLAPSTVLAESRRPNIIFILTDDLDTEYPNGTWIEHFPRLKSLLADQGTTLKNFFVS